MVKEKIGEEIAPNAGEMRKTGRIKCRVACRWQVIGGENDMGKIRHNYSNQAERF